MKMHRLLNSQGFSFIECLIGIGLLSFGAVAVIKSSSTMNRSHAGPLRKSAMIELASLTSEHLSDINTCSSRIGASGLDYAGALPQEVKAILYKANGDVLLETDKLVEGVKYEVKLRLESLSGEYPAGTVGRATATRRFLSSLIIIGRDHGKELPGKNYDQIRSTLMVELDTSGAIRSCTNSHFQIEEMLVGNRHTFSDCLAARGSIYPTKYGLICRIPNENQTGDPLGPCPSGWLPFRNYTSTINNTFENQHCKKKKCFPMGPRIKVPRLLNLVHTYGHDFMDYDVVPHEEGAELVYFNHSEKQSKSYWSKAFSMPPFAPFFCSGTCVMYPSEGHAIVTSRGCY